ncbi:MAG TPA: hypothetical protein VGG10_12515 [Rhizomicrobium sp.]|jgi:hypothetical protein
MRSALILAVICTVGVAHASTADCVNMRDVRDFDYKTAKLAVANMTDSRQFEVAFSGTCGYTKFHPQLGFDATPAGFCLKAGNVLRSYDGGGCIVRQITQITPAH